MADQETVRNLFRAGYAAKGVVYAMVGLLGLLAALGIGGETTDASGALETIASQPFGKILLGIVIVGLVGFVLWRIVQAVWDPDQLGTDSKGLAKRAGFLGSGLVYGALTYGAIRLLTRGESSGGGNAKQEWSAWLLEKPGGAVLLALIGLGVIALGCWQIYRAVTRKYLEEYDVSKIPADQLRRVKTISDIGLSARGVTFALIGGFVVVAAMQSDPGEIKGLGESLQALAQQPYGPVLLGLVSIGLVCYGVYCFFEAKFRDFPRMSMGHVPGGGAARRLVGGR